MDKSPDEANEPVTPSTKPTEPVVAKTPEPVVAKTPEPTKPAILEPKVEPKVEPKAEVKAVDRVRVVDLPRTRGNKRITINSDPPIIVNGNQETIGVEAPCTIVIDSDAGHVATLHITLR